MTTTILSSSASTAEVAERIREASARRSPLRIVGAGTWLDANRPVGGATPLLLSALTGIVEYEPGDLTLTARAGTALREIAAITSANDQWLTLDPHGSDDGTIGATVATASAGPLAHAFGTPRDLVLGIEFVTGKGAVARGGGRVVKNVAGFDLTRLLTGSWGSLGAITEVTLRLRARPETDRTIAVAVRDIATLASQLRSTAQVPLAVELVDAAMGRQLGLGDTALLVRLAGNEADVGALRAVFAKLGDVRDVGADVWSRLRTIEPPGATVVRLSAPASQLAGTWSAARAMAGRIPGALVHATCGRGIVRVILPWSDETSLRAALSHSFAGTRIHERLPVDLWRELAPSRTDDRLSRGVKLAFDPERVLNPGILGDA